LSEKTAKLGLQSSNWHGPGQCWGSPITTALKVSLLGMF